MEKKSYDVLVLLKRIRIFIHLLSEREEEEEE